MTVSVRRFLRERRSWAAWPILLLVLMSFTYVGVKVPQHAQFSPYDEYVYLDYLDKVPSQLIVHKNEEVGDFARNEISCRGVVNYGSFGEACDRGTHRDDVKYPYSGLGGADIYSPLYFMVTWTIAQPLTWFGIDLLDAGRLVGGVWLAAGLVLLYILMRRLGVPTPLALGLNLLVLATPAVFWADTYLSTDAPALAVGAGVGLLALLIGQKKISVWWLVLASVLSVLLKVQNLAPVALAGLGLIAYRLQQQFVERRSEASGRHRPFVSLLGDRTIVIALLSVVAGVIAQAGWLVARSALEVPARGPAALALDAQRLSSSALINESFKFLFNSGFTDLGSGPTGLVAAHVVTALTLAGIIGLIVMGAGFPKHYRVIAVTTLVIALVTGPALALAAKYIAGYYFPLPLRYGLVLLPAFMVCGALFITAWRQSGWILLAGGGVATLLVIAL